MSRRRKQLEQFGIEAQNEDISLLSTAKDLGVSVVNLASDVVYTAELLLDEVNTTLEIANIHLDAYKKELILKEAQKYMNLNDQLSMQEAIKLALPASMK